MRVSLPAGDPLFSGRVVRDSKRQRATRGYQKHRISPRIQVKIRKILNFLFFLDIQRFNRQDSI